MKVTCQVENKDDHTKQDLFVDSHWNNCSKLVILRIGELEITILGEELKKAIDNCLNK